MTTQNIVSYFDKTYRISLQLPQGWDAGNDDYFGCLLLAQPVQNYRTNIGFTQQSSSEEITPALFQGLIETTKADLITNYHAYTLVQEGDLWLDSRPAYLQQYAWQDEASGQQFMQIMALIVRDTQTICEIHGASLHNQAEQSIPMLIEIMQSIRFIPAE